MRTHVRILTGLLISLGGVVAGAQGAPVITVSDFQDGATDGWEVAPAAQRVAPEVIATGGPDGDGDSFLELTSLGGNGPGSKLAAFNLTRDWIGNYTQMGATAIEVDMMNDSGKPLNMRVVLFGDGTDRNNRWTSTTAFDLPSDGQWHHAVFSLSEDDLTSVLGRASYDNVMQDVLRVMLRHDENRRSNGTAIAAMVGLDNIQLVGTLIDFNGDGILDVVDVNLLLQEVKSGNHSLEFDLNSDEVVDTLDIDELVTSPDNLNTYIGDADLNGEFGTSDLVSVFTAGQYEDDAMMNSSWETGDWNGDAEFGTGDLVAAFQDGGFELGPRPSIANVPEPRTGFLLGTLLVMAVIRRRIVTAPLFGSRCGI